MEYVESKVDYYSREMVLAEELYQERMHRLLNMSKEVSRFDRMLRKRNQCLQTQLDVTIKIYDKEYKMCRSKANNEIRECNKMYRNIQGIYPGLESYSHPDIRSMVLAQEKKQKQAKFNMHKKLNRGSRFTVGDSRHIARMNHSQIQTNMYSTYTAANQSLESEKSEETAEDINDIIQQNEERRIADEQIIRERDGRQRSQAWVRQGSYCLSNGEDVQENEHPITALVRSMRQRIYSAPATRKVQFPSNGHRRFHHRPQTAIGVVEEAGNTNPKTAAIGRLNGEIETPPTFKSSARPPHLTSGHRDSVTENDLSPEILARIRLDNSKTEEFVKRPKSAPPNYELLGKSPALPRQQVAGIMAELESRRAATRSLIEKSRIIQKQVKRITADQGIESDSESEDVKH
ncbi:hypothetical protein LOTGIDRAFT_232587 [Lottia gigantea]|uniref:Uncharacterized protein n=1 Tax=Lottia gigantea TaxID=225164 RepID=V4AEE3_LOTGI|nr:hypothetical protein LOTGIDRAFT_232587 [Lottia gigantea]ESO93505.1 hypothetical protein LOTGIDRAFT_232587 [Lottia gigantea]